MIKSEPSTVITITGKLPSNVIGDDTLAAVKIFVSDRNDEAIDPLMLPLDVGLSEDDAVTSKPVAQSYPEFLT